jgi:hypothetical protein
MADGVKIHLDNTHLGSGPPDSKLSFKVKAGTGFVVNAMLDCDMKVVATWESVEIVGKTASEVLLPKGMYTLQLSVAYTTTKDSDFVVDFTFDNKKVQPMKDTLELTGKRPDIGRVLAVCVIR